MTPEPSLPTRSRLPAWARRTLVILAVVTGVLVLTLLAATASLPHWVETRGAALARQALGRQVSIEHVAFKPWRLALALEGVRVAAAGPSAAPLFTLESLDCALSLRSLWRGRLVVESVQLRAPVLRVSRLSDGHYDIDDLIQRFAQPKTAGETPPTEFAIYNIELHGGALHFDDRPVQRQHAVTALRLDLPFLSTLAADVDVRVEPLLSGKLNGVGFRSQAQAQPFAAQHQARFSFKLAGLDLAPLAAYLPASLPVRLAAGRLDTDLSLELAQPAKAAPTIKLSGQLALRESDWRTPANAPLLSWARLAVDLTDIQPLRRAVGLGAVRWDQPQLHLQRDRRGQLNVALPAAGEQAEPGAPSWTLQLARFELNDGRLDWRDESVSPAADLALRDLSINLGPTQWPLAESPVQLRAGAQLDSAKLLATAELSAAQLEAHAELSGLTLARLGAYLPLPKGTRAAATLAGQADLRLPQPLAPDPLQRADLRLQQVSVSDAGLSLPGEGKPMLALKLLSLDTAHLVPARRTADLGQLSLDSARLQLTRDAAGRLSFEALRPPPGPSDAAQAPPWAVTLAGLALERAALRWHDGAVPGGAALVVEPLQLRLNHLAWPAVAGASPLPIDGLLQLKLAALGAKDQPLPGTSGSLQWQGRAGLAPLGFSGALSTERLPLQLFDAYLDPAWGLHLQRAELATRAQLFAQQQAGGWKAELSGDLTLAALSLQQARWADGERQIDEDLLSWQRLQLDAVKLGLVPGAPLKLAIGQAELADFYARLIINEQGRFNLRDLGPADATASPPAAGPATPAAPAPQISIGRTLVKQGQVDFSDRFIKPNYSARLSDLQGSLGAFASGSTEMAPLTLRGRVAGTGALEIDGQLNPSGAPLAMDLRANANDIELAPLSPYAAKYAGYAIERGKLSTRLQYRIEPRGGLQASNQIILNQLTFGDKVDSPDATKLPVQLALALLKDRDGVIDVNLPVSGSINDPDFSVGGIVWKLIVNLIGKALSAPFSLFSGGDASEESRVGFAPGVATLANLEQVDRVAKLLNERPGVHLTITGWADATVEADAIRTLRLEQALEAERRRDQGAAPDATLAPADRERLLKRLYQGTPLPTKPRNVLGLVKDIPASQMQAMLLAAYPADDETARQLALSRGVNVRDALIARGVPNARIFLAAPKLREPCGTACEAGWQPQAELELGAH
jgi:uncharacterized protein involved in outer membrane biogenesis